MTGQCSWFPHDRYFINKLADRILYLTPHGIMEYTGNYDAFFASRQKATAAKKAEDKPQAKALDYNERKRFEAQRRKTLNRFAKVEEFIVETENKITELTWESDDPEIATDYVRLNEISDQIEALRRELDGYMEEWETLQMEIDKME